MIFIIQPSEKKIWNPKDIEPFLDEISPDSSSSSIQSIHLSGNSFSEQVIEILVDRIHGHKQIKKAILSDIFTGRSKPTIPPSISSFARLFSGNSCLVELDLSDNAFGAPGAKALAQIITGNLSIQTLKINNNGLGPEGGKIIAEALTKAALASRECGGSTNGNASQLKKLVIGRNRLEASSVDIAKALSLHSNFRELSMPQNGIRPEWIVGFLEELRGCGALELLDLQDNTLTESGASALAASLSFWPLLSNLNLADCLLRPEGAITLFKGIADWSSQAGFKVLNLQFNEINESALLIGLQVAKEKIACLERFELNGNEFHPQGKAAIELQRIFEGKQVLDEWDELEYSEEEEESEEESGEESHSEQQKLLEKLSQLEL